MEELRRDRPHLTHEARLKWRILVAGHLANIYAMLAVASLAAAFFQGTWLFGLPLSLFCIWMVYRFTFQIAYLEQELERWKSFQASTSLSDISDRSQ